MSQPGRNVGSRSLGMMMRKGGVCWWVFFVVVFDMAGRFVLFGDDCVE